MNSSGVRPLARMRLCNVPFATSRWNRGRDYVALLDKDYVTSSLPGDSPAICCKNLYDHLAPEESTFKP